MCTAITLSHNNSHYFGRNLDLEYHYHETVTITPRRFVFDLRNGRRINMHFALIGMATVSDGYPLYYEATNEKGLSLAGLNFPRNAVYYPPDHTRDNIAPFELIPWVLGQCTTVDEALALLKHSTLWDTPFSDEFPLSPLHWLLADGTRSVTLEPLAGGLMIHENPVGVLTNNPPFDYHLHHLAHYLNLTPAQPVNRFSEAIPLTPYSLGMGAIGLPGDLSSASRFVRATFVKLNSVGGDSEEQQVSRFFHILGSVAQQNGLNRVRNDAFEYTVYSSCCNTVKGIYYYTTYENSRISAVDMHREDLDGNTLYTYPLITDPQIRYQN